MNEDMNSINISEFKRKQKQLYYEYINKHLGLSDLRLMAHNVACQIEKAETSDHQSDLDRQFGSEPIRTKKGWLW